MLVPATSVIDPPTFTVTVLPVSLIVPLLVKVPADVGLFWNVRLNAAVTVVPVAMEMLPVPLVASPTTTDAAAISPRLVM